MYPRESESYSKPRKKSQWFIALIALLFASTVFPFHAASAQGVAQQQSNEEVGMEVHLDFDKGAPRAIWTIYAQKSVGGVQIIDETRHIPLTCTNYGVDIGYGVATFRSVERDFIKCFLPDFAAEIKKISNGEIIIGKRCQCKAPWIAANVDLAYDPSSVGPLSDSNPLFYHNDMSYGIPYADPPNLVATNLEYVGASQAQSSSFYLDAKNPWNAVWSGEDGAEFLAEADFAGWAAYLARYTLTTIKNSLHWANGQQIDPVTGSAGSFDMGTGASVIFFGVNPDTGSFLNGSVTNINWDPGCRGGWG